jgi:hypothetical protein
LIAYKAYTFPPYNLDHFTKITLNNQGFSFVKPLFQARFQEKLLKKNGQKQHSADSV